MAQTLTLDAAQRDNLGTGGARAERRKGMIPAVVYGGSEPPVHIVLEERILRRHSYKRSFTRTPLRIKIGDGNAIEVMARGIQFSPVKDRLTHVDFLRVTPNTRLSVPVQVEFVEHEASPGLRSGGVLNVVRHEVLLVGPIKNMPDKLTVDLTGTNIGESIKSDTLKIPATIRTDITGRAFVIATIAPPTVEVETVAQEEQEEEKTETE